MLKYAQDEVILKGQPGEYRMIMANLGRSEKDLWEKIKAKVHI